MDTTPTFPPFPEWLLAAVDHVGRGTYESPCTLPAQRVSMDHTTTADPQE